MRRVRVPSVHWARRAAQWVVLAGLLAGCGGDAPPRLVPLAGLAPFATVTDQKARTFSTGKRQVRLVKENGEEWLEAEIYLRDWKAMEQQAGAWRLTPPLRSTGRGPTDTVRLETLGRRFQQVRKGDEPPADLVGTFAMVGTWLVLQLAPDEEPPEKALMAVRVQRRSRAGATQRVDGRRFSGDGLCVWPGERIELLVDFPPQSVLHVATCVEALLSSDTPRKYRFKIQVNDRVLLDHEQDEAKDGSVVVHELAMPSKGRSAARLVFETSGPLGATSFLAPVIGPAARDHLDSRGDPLTVVRASAARAEDPRPDLLLFVADTFRADNMAAYGGTLGLTPTLDELAAQSLCFTEARSVATYTAPAHATLFTGQFPHTVAADAFDKSLPDQVVTIAESLAASGYRTGAITGAVIVSRSFGFAQGFEWFDELHGGMEATLRRARTFLEADDGRPVFLFVHTYRAHTPYEPDPETHARLAGGDGEVEFSVVNKEIEALLAGERTPEVAERAGVLAGELEHMYRAGVAGLDREMAAFLADPQIRRIVDRGFLVFTSDHGEAFLEHGELYHAGRVYDEQLRVPLLVHGPGIEPGRRDGLVSLVDVAPTLAELAGLARRSEWRGASLLAADAARPYQYAFECRTDRDATLAVIRGEQKLIGLLDAGSRELVGMHAAFDLAADPREEHDLVPEAPGWPQELYRHLEENHAALVVPRIGPAPALLDTEQQAEMRKLGYGGSDDGR